MGILFDLLPGLKTKVYCFLKCYNSTMNSMSKKPKNIQEYIAAAPKLAQERLQEMLVCLRKAAPGAEESLKWGQPALSFNWILFQFAVFKNHISLYPTPSVVKAFEDELSEYQTSINTIQFPLEQPLPVDLINKIAAYRVKEAEQGVKWMG